MSKFDDDIAKSMKMVRIAFFLWNMAVLALTAFTVLNYSLWGLLYLILLVRIDKKELEDIMKELKEKLKNESED